MKLKKQNSVISLSDYRQKKLEKKQTKKALLDKSEDSNRNSSSSSAKIFYMSNYLKTKKIPELTELKKDQDKSFLPPSNKEMDNIIILDQYRKEKNRKRVWKKEFSKEALSVAGMAFLFLFTFNLAVSIKSDSPSKTFSFTGPVARGKPIRQGFKENLGLKPANAFRKIASPKEKRKQAFSHKKWVQKIKQLDRKAVILGTKPSSSEYTGF